MASKDFRKLADEIQRVARTAYEEDLSIHLQIRVENLLDLFLKDLEIKGSERIDALYGKAVIIKYVDPKSFESTKKFEHALEQIKDYITKSSSYHQAKDEVPLYFGIALDGFQIGFIRFRNGKWQSQGPLPVNEFTVSKVIHSLQGLKPMKQSSYSDYQTGECDYGP